MRQKPKQSQYNQTINLTSHLILTQPNAVMALLANYDVQFEEKPSRAHLINEVVELMKESTQFTSDLGELLAIHVQENGKEMMQLEGQNFNYHDEDEDAFLGGLIKGAVGLVGGLFKKKRRNKGDGGAAVRAAASAQAARAKRDMAMQMERMRNEARIRAAEARREREAKEAHILEEKKEAERQKREDKEKAEKKQMMLMIGAGMVGLVVVGLVMSNSGKKQTPYYQQPMQPMQPMQSMQPQMPMR